MPRIAGNTRSGERSLEVILPEWLQGEHGSLVPDFWLPDLSIFLWLLLFLADHRVVLEAAEKSLTEEAFKSRVVRTSCI